LENMESLYFLTMENNGDILLYPTALFPLSTTCMTYHWIADYMLDTMSLLLRRKQMIMGKDSINYFQRISQSFTLLTLIFATIPNNYGSLGQRSRTQYIMIYERTLYNAQYSQSSISRTRVNNSWLWWTGFPPSKRVDEPIWHARLETVSLDCSPVLFGPSKTAKKGRRFDRIFG